MEGSNIKKDWTSFRWSVWSFAPSIQKLYDSTSESLPRQKQKRQRRDSNSLVQREQWICNPSPLNIKKDLNLSSVIGDWLFVWSFVSSIQKTTIVLSRLCPQKIKRIGFEVHFTSYMLRITDYENHNRSASMRHFSFSAMVSERCQENSLSDVRFTFCLLQ